MAASGIGASATPSAGGSSTVQASASESADAMSTDDITKQLSETVAFARK